MQITSHDKERNEADNDEDWNEAEPRKNKTKNIT